MFRLTNNQINKAIQILAVLRDHGEPMTLRELAPMMERSKSDVARYTDVLLRIGVLERNRCKTCGTTHGMVIGENAEKYLNYWGVKT